MPSTNTPTTGGMIHTAYSMNQTSMYQDQRLLTGHSRPWSCPPSAQTSSTPQGQPPRSSGHPGQHRRRARPLSHPTRQPPPWRARRQQSRCCSCRSRNRSGSARARRYRCRYRHRCRHRLATARARSHHYSPRLVRSTTRRPRPRPRPQPPPKRPLAVRRKPKSAGASCAAR